MGVAEVLKWISNPAINLELPKNITLFATTVCTGYDEEIDSDDDEEQVNLDWSGVTPFIKRRLFKLLDPITWKSPNHGPILYIAKLLAAFDEKKFPNDFQSLVDIFLLYLNLPDGISSHPSSH